MKKANLEKAVASVIKPRGILQVDVHTAPNEDAHEVSLRASYFWVSNIAADMTSAQTVTHLGYMSEHFLRGLLENCHEEMERRGIHVPAPKWAIEALTRKKAG